MSIAADVARAARPGADAMQRLLHGRHDRGMLAHAQIVVGAPDGDRLRAVVSRKALGIGKIALGAQDIDEDAVAALVMKAVNRCSENAFVVQRRPRPRRLYRPNSPKANANDSQQARIQQLGD